MPEATREELLKLAAKATENSYAPYSKFKVGAAVLTESGDVFTGCNVENASFGLTMCAERNAVFQAVAQGHKKFKVVAIVADGDAMPYPCGACRQVLSEFCEASCEVLVAPIQDLTAFERSSLEVLLANSFTLKPPAADSD